MKIHFDGSIFAIIFIHKKAITRVFTILQIGYTWYGKTAQNEFSYDRRWVINNKNEKRNPLYANFFLLQKKYCQHAVFNHFKILGANDSKANQ